MSDWKHTEAELQRAEHYIVRAEEMFAKGFTSKSDKKDANDYLARAYDVLVHYTFNYAVWPLRKVDSSHRSYYEDKKIEALAFGNFPALHVWAKNPNKYTKLYADWPKVVDRGNHLAGLRLKYEATPLAEKPKSKTRELAEARQAVAKTCQICNRPILAETGLIAHHGYQRPGEGYQTASCAGARHEPFEKSRDTLGLYLVRCREQLSGSQDALRMVKEDRVPLRFGYGTGKYDNRHKEIRAEVAVFRGTFDAAIAQHKPLARWSCDLPVSFGSLKEKRLHAIAADIKNQKDYIAYQQKRYDEWKAVL